MSVKRIGYCLSLAYMLSFTWVIIYGGLMSYKSVELEQAYDKLHDNYWDLIEWLQEHAPLALELYKNRNKS
jgi:hypothetical protein